MTTIMPSEYFNMMKKQFILPKKTSHKGQNGKLLIIGGSSLFHAASLWAASVASKVVDMVHYSSTLENNEIFINLKTKFLDGIVIPQKELLQYVEEDDAILIGPGMLRGIVSDDVLKEQDMPFDKIIHLNNESDFTYSLTRFLIQNYPEKKFILDAGALQMLDTQWLKELKIKPILTPHSKEFEHLFNHDISKYSQKDKLALVTETAKKNNSVILMKYIEDFISDGRTSAIISGGNEGLAKGGSGDVLAGLTAAFATKNDQFTACLVASFLLKSAADDLYNAVGPIYNTSDLIVQIGKTTKKLLFDF